MQEEVSPSIYYGLNDMVKISCHDCKGCFDCCQGMGNSIILNPYDIYLLTGNLHESFEELLEGKVELGVEDGMIIPHLVMDKSRDCCSFLNKEGRCSIHEFRPNLCRLFPLGREYSGDKMRYFLLENVCNRRDKVKIKVGKWLGYQNIHELEEFLLCWHTLIKEFEEEIPHLSQEEMKKKNMYLLNLFFLTPYIESTKFTMQFYERLDKYKAYQTFP